MQGFVVKLRPDGVFEAPSRYVGRSSIRVLHDVDSHAAPWMALALDDAGVKWTKLESFHSLDAALDFAVLEAIRDSDLPEYSVVLPDGVRFTRPGRIPLEQAMASAGWTYVTSLIGFLMATTPADASQFDARRLFLGVLEGTSAALGDVSLSDEDEHGRHWCADVSIEHGGFLHADEIQAEAQSAFALEGINVLPLFDFRTRTSVAGREASVIAFPEDRIVRRLTAA